MSTKKVCKKDCGNGGFRGACNGAYDVKLQRTVHARLHQNGLVGTACAYSVV